MNLHQVKQLIDEPTKLYKQMIKENYLPPLCPAGGTFTFDEPTNRWELLKEGKLYVINIDGTLMFYQKN